MSALGNIIVVGAVWLVYTFLFFGLTANAQQEKNAGPEPPPMEVDATVNAYPLAFRWSVDTAFTTDAFARLKQSVVSDMDENNILEITGRYFEAEENPTEAATLGFARAEEVKGLLSDAVPPDRIRLRASVMDEKEGVREGYFEAASFAWIKPEEKAEETVEELEDRIIIRFPFGSAQKEYDPAVDAYLEKLATRIKETGETVQLTGHTDDADSDEFNYKLGMDRAEGIRDHLVRLGVKPGQISVASKGESQPVDSNETEEGRHNNRRVEVRLNKQ